jgi:hypothetical protein
VQAAGLDALTALTSVDGAAPRTLLWAADGCVAPAMAVHAGCAGVQRAGLGLLGALATAAPNRPALLAHIWLVRVAMAAHPAHAGVQAEALRALERLAADADSRPAVRTLGDLIDKAGRTHARVPAVAARARALSALLALSAADLGRLRPVAAVACGRGIGLAVCESLGLIVTSNFDNCTISAFALAGPGHRLLGTWGGKAPGPLQFDFESGAGDSGGLCFTVPGPAMGGGGKMFVFAGAVGGAAATPATTTPQLLVASAGTRRVVVLDMGGVVGGGGVGGPGGGAPVPTGAFGGASADDPAPRCVAACAGLVAVSGWMRGDAGDHTVALYAVGTWARVRVVGVGRGRGAGEGQLSCPFGLRFSADGARLLVADHGNDRVCCFRVSDGGFSGVVASKGAHGLDSPTDVVEVAGGVLVADFVNDRVVGVPADGSPATVLGSVAGSEPGQFYHPTSLFMSTDGAQVIVREGTGGRFQVFGAGV